MHDLFPVEYMLNIIVWSFMIRICLSCLCGCRCSPACCNAMTAFTMFLFVLKYPYTIKLSMRFTYFKALPWISVVDIMLFVFTNIGQKGSMNVKHLRCLPPLEMFSIPPKSTQFLSNHTFGMRSNSFSCPLDTTWPFSIANASRWHRKNSEPSY